MDPRTLVLMLTASSPSVAWVCALPSHLFLIPHAPHLYVLSLSFFGS